MNARPSPLTPRLPVLLAALLLLPPLWATAQDQPEPRLVPRRQPGQLVDPGFSQPPAPPPVHLSPQQRARLYGLEERDPTRLDPEAPASHTATFLQGQHGAAARASDAACMGCHQERQCVDCHNGPLRPSALHPPGYLAYHAIEARQDAQSCSACHSPQTFCQDCHKLARLGTRRASRPAPGVRVHPESWLGATPGPQHSVEARRNLMACVSCHTEDDCVRCHTNINPHPSGYQANCAAALRRNPRPCLRCHTDTQRLQQMCR